MRVSLTESELHDRKPIVFLHELVHLPHVSLDQGDARERLSKRWMPLDKFTEEAMEGLCRGDLQIPVGNSKLTWERFERGKIEEMTSRNRKT